MQSNSDAVANLAVENSLRPSVDRCQRRAVRK